MRRRLALLLCSAAPVLLATPATVKADVFGSITLASASGAEQADEARDPAISADGRYIAFDGSIGGATGVWRRDLSSGALEQVAGAGAELPSISGDGQYVSFTTAEALVPGDKNDGPDVYVRNMDLPDSGERAPMPCEEGATTQCPYELASAVNGSEEALTYETSSPKDYGSVASGRSALSEDGRKVVFVTTAVSNFTTAKTPALQVAVRDLETKQTQLVSALTNPATGSPELNEAGQDQPVPTIAEGSQVFGAVYPEETQIPRFSQHTEVAGVSPFPRASVGASISADGSTVAWMGQDVQEQARVLAAETAMGPSYTEPLWRRIDEGPGAPIRRVTGGSDPASRACEESGESSLSEPGTLSDPCQGPFEVRRGTIGEQGISNTLEADYLPRLSANGETVAFLANAHELASGEEFGASGQSDLYVVNMQSGLTRRQSLERLTEIAGGNSGEVARTAPIVDFGVSPDGTQIAFSTRRTVFGVGSLVSVPAAKPGMIELFDFDLANDTLTRVTHGFEGEGQPSEQPHTEAISGEEDPYKKPFEGSFSPSFSSDGNTLAFSSTADNLVYGDGNEASDVFVVSRVAFRPQLTEQYISAPPPAPAVVAAWKLGVTALSRPDGSVLLDIDVPGAGKLTASAASSLLVRRTTPSSKARRAGRRAVREARTSATVVSRVVASSSKEDPQSEGGIVVVALALSSRYRALAAQRGGLSAIVNVAFAAVGRPELHQRITVTFLRSTRSTRRVKAKAKVKPRRRS